jgi:anti-sigma factor RsiW
MHNCKLTRNSFVDLALDELPPARSTELLAELTDCRDCREEYAALGSTLHVSNQALRSALPGEEFWPGYRARLHAKLLAGTDQQSETAGAHSMTPVARATRPGTFGARVWLPLSTMATTYVRVPIPAALGVLLLFAAFFVVQRWRGPVNATTSTPAALVRTNTVEVPVIQEKVITRVVYVEKKDRRSARGVKHSLSVPIPGGTNNGVAGMGSDPATGTALSLSGFKPTDEVKLTIIKGSYKDQKR